MGGAIWRFFKRFWAGIAGLLGGLLLLARWTTDLVGRSTFMEDLEALLGKLRPVTDFFARQPEWLFYPFCLAMLLVGVISAADRWAPVLERWRSAPTAPPATPAVPRMPDMSLGDLVRYLATQTDWAHQLGEEEDWTRLLDQELVDRFGHGAIVAYGRFQGEHYRRPERTPKIDKISSDFWSHVELGVNRYFLEAVDANDVRGDSYGYYDVRVYRSEAERVWPKAKAGHWPPLPNLEKALELRRERLAAQSG